MTTTLCRAVSSWGRHCSIGYTAIITGPTNTRASNQVEYFMPNTLAGFGVQLGHWRGENPNGRGTRPGGFFT